MFVAKKSYQCGLGYIFKYIYTFSEFLGLHTSIEQNGTKGSNISYKHSHSIIFTFLFCFQGNYWMSWQYYGYSWQHLQCFFLSDIFQDLSEAAGN